MITRRDFLNGVALAVGAGLTPAQLLRAAEPGAASPPVLRGSTAEAFAVAHALRDGTRFDVDPLPIDEEVDLVVVGAGLSGLAAALLYRGGHPRARVLILENHDDFGGHAQRVELPAFGRTLIGYGGSESIQSPGEWSRASRGLLRSLGVDLQRFESAFHRSLYPGLGLSRGVFFHKEAFGVDKLVTGDPTRMPADDIPQDRTNARTAAAFAEELPLSAESRAKIAAVYAEARDVLAGKSVAEKEHILKTTSYRDFLKTHWGLDDTAANAFQNRSHDYFAIGIDGIPAHDALEMGLPGFRLPDAEAAAEDPYIHHFPDGNASLARLLVRALIPAAASGNKWDDVVEARFDYAQLDDAKHPVRLRLGSTVVHAKNRARGRVDVGYVRAGQLHRVSARHVIYAGHAAMVPYLLPELSGHAAQRAALASSVRAPLAYVKVAVRNWQPWVSRGVHEISSPMGFFARAKLDYPVSLGGYRFPQSPDEPIGLHLVHIPTPGNTGADQRTAWRVGRSVLFGMSFADFEVRVRDELNRMLGAGGFDAERDIGAIVVCRWGHGYAYNFNSLYDQETKPPRTETARARVGRIVLAGSDAGWSAYAHGAFDEAARAVRELRR